MTDRIHQLDSSVINKIAAGEVIERPANVVKELLENSVDALATRVEVEVEQGGVELIRVVDNGEGIHPDDIQLAVTGHATSKIDSADDLFQVHTMGFRGEALASVAEVSRLRIRSRREEAVSGVELEVLHGRFAAPQSCGCPVGTLIEVRQLFANTPVRRKFLKTTATEFGHISEHFTRIALAHPRLHMLLKHNDKIVFELPATGQLLDRLQLFYGGELAEKLIWVESTVDDVRLWGYVAHPSESKSTRKGQHLYLNGRWIQDRSLQHALNEAYRGLLMVGRQPIAFLFIDMPSSQVDVNVHPTKIEVRFRDSQQLYRQLLSMLRTKFLSLNLESELKLRSAPAQSAVSNLHQRELRLQPAVWASPAGLRPERLSPPLLPNSSEFGFRPEPPGSAVGIRDAALNGTSPRSPLDRALIGNAWPGPANDVRLGNPPSAASPQFLGSSTTGDPLGTLDSESGPEQPPPSIANRVPAEMPAPTSADHSTPHGEFVDMPAVRAMQIHDCYLVLESEDGLTVIDQHALHERILYENLRQRVLAGSVESQRMLVPKPIELGPREAALLLANTEQLAKLGFDVQEFGNNTVLVSSYPAMLGQTDPETLVRDMAEQFEADEKPTRRDVLDELLHMMSCKAAIKAGQRLSPEEIDSLLAQRHLVDDAHHCPHGRPTALVLTQTELDRQFGRLG